MAIQKEFVGETFTGVKLYRNYSDAGKYIIQNETGIRYEEAVDVEAADFTYSESTIDIPHRDSSSSSSSGEN